LRWATAGVWMGVLAWACLAWFLNDNGRLERSSAKGLVQACEAAWARQAPAPQPPSGPHAPESSADGPARLVLLGRRSFSAHFYTEGRAVRVDELVEAQARWPIGGTCLAVKLDDPQSMEAARAGVTLVEDLGVHHERQLWWALPPAGVKERP
ncbi:MAG: hypothetical protein ACKPCJ_03495, partial [Betaproteobacteria bacterium]